MSISSFFQQSVFYVELLALVVGLYQWYKGRLDKILLLVLGYLILTVTIELGGDYIYRILHKSNNRWLYNAYNFITFNYWFLIFYQILKKGKWIIVSFSLIYSLYAISIWVRYRDFFTHLERTAFILGAILLTILIMWYFIETLKSDQILTVFNQPVFWVSIGLLLYYLTIIPFRIVNNFYTLRGGTDIHHLFILKYIVANGMYLFIAYAFTCRRTPIQ